MIELRFLRRFKGNGFGDGIIEDVLQYRNPDLKERNTIPSVLSMEWKDVPVVEETYRVGPPIRPKIDEEKFIKATMDEIDAFKNRLLKDPPVVQPRFVGWGMIKPQSRNDELYPIRQPTFKKYPLDDCAVFIIPESELTEEVLERWKVK